MIVKHAFTVDIAPFSQYPDEEEELLSPGVCFTVERVEFNKDNNKHEIYLDLIQQYSRKLTYLFYKEFPLSFTHLIHLVLALFRLENSKYC
jgi:hypothetical protein